MATKALPLNAIEAKKVKLQASYYVIINNEMSRRAILRSLLKRVDEVNMEYVLDEVHKGICRMHTGGRSMATRVIYVDYYWLP